MSVYQNPYKKLGVTCIPEDILQEEVDIEKYFDVVYDKFMDKVGDRCKISLIEWEEITSGIFEQFKYIIRSSL